jgi:hypothetical protein
MTQEEIMFLFDHNPGTLFTPREIFKKLKQRVSLRTVYKSLEGICKRREYYCVTCNRVRNGKFKQGVEYPVTAFGLKPR